MKKVFSAMLLGAASAIGSILGGMAITKAVDSPSVKAKFKSFFEKLKKAFS